MNQHFIFNALNLIKSSVILDNGKACQLIDVLAKYMRFQMQYEAGEEVTWKQQLQSIEAYVWIQRERYSKLRITTELSETWRKEADPMLSYWIEKEVSAALHRPECRQQLDIVIQENRDDIIYLQLEIQGEQVEKVYYNKRGKYDEGDTGGG